MPLTKLKEHLDSHKIKYVTISHSPAYTAQEVAQSAHIAGREMAKTVIVKLDGKIAMVVLPATSKVDFDVVKNFTKASKVELANEHEFNNLFPGCELGAMPPFGNLFGIKVFITDNMSQNEQIAFNAGSHSELIKLAYKDFSELVQPEVIQV